MKINITDTKRMEEDIEFLKESYDRLLTIVEKQQIQLNIISDILKSLNRITNDK